MYRAGLDGLESYAGLTSCPIPLEFVMTHLPDSACWTSPECLCPAIAIGELNSLGRKLQQPGYDVHAGINLIVVELGSRKFYLESRVRVLQIRTRLGTKVMIEGRGEDGRPLVDFRTVFDNENVKSARVCLKLPVTARRTTRRTSSTYSEFWKVGVSSFLNA